MNNTTLRKLTGRFPMLLDYSAHSTINSYSTDLCFVHHLCFAQDTDEKNER